MFLYFFSQCIYCLVLFLARLIVPFRLGIRKRYPNSLFFVRLVFDFKSIGCGWVVFKILSRMRVYGRCNSVCIGLMSVLFGKKITIPKN